MRQSADKCMNVQRNCTTDARPAHVHLFSLNTSGKSVGSGAGTLVVCTPLGGLEVDVHGRLSLELSRCLERGSAAVESACRADRRSRRAAIRSSGVASRIRRWLRVFWR